jgi:predicted RNA-binding protein YlqC (UPF0109 family)
VSDPDVAGLDEPEVVPLGGDATAGAHDPGPAEPDAVRPLDGGPVDDEDEDAEDDANRAPAPVAAAVLTHITRSVVDDPDAVDITAIPMRAGRVRLAVRVAPNDFGRLIGRRGRVAAAVRTLVGAAAVKDGVDVEVEFVE